MQVLTTIKDFRAARLSCDGTLGLVPTMGSLHEGHLALVRQARSENRVLAASIFVNPSQFGPSEDYCDYPRDMERDLALLDAEGTDLVFAPPAEEVYPPGYATWIDLPDMVYRLEGEHRPSHFRGVATVVAKLFNIVEPDVAYFGQKDGQQVAVIRRLVADLNLDVQVQVVPTVREADGLALSSRNVYLSGKERRAAPVIFRSLSRAREMWAGGEGSAEVLRGEVRGMLEAEPLVSAIDYVSIADPDTLDEMDGVRSPAMVSTAVRIGRTRLIDNVLLS